MVVVGTTSKDIKLQTDSIDALVVKGTGNIEIAKDLDVDGHTNLDNVRYRWYNNI